jgi:signal transduction histidine kinase
VTLLVALGAAAAITLSLALVYVVLSAELSDALEAGLTARSHDLAATVAYGHTNVLADDPLAQLYAPNGALLASSPSLTGQQRLLPPGTVRALSAEESTTTSVWMGGESVPVRLLSQRLGAHGDVLTVGVSAAPAQAARQRLLTVLLLVDPLLTALLALGGWWVVRAALHPVGELTRQAAVISSLDTDRRLDPVPGDDEIARLAQTLEAMLARLRTAFARERAFVDDASHELRTPVAVLRGELELALSADGDPAEVRRSLRAALGEAERLSRLAEDLLLLARHQEGSVVMRRQPVDLLDLAGAESHRLQNVLGVRIEVTGDPVVVTGDPDRLRQLLGNLAANSAAAGASRVRVEVTSTRESVLVEVADDGPGFPAELLPQAFERFVRGDHRRRSGTGLGLAIVRSVAAGHGGTAKAYNGGPFGGAVVVVRLPS